MSVNIDDIIVYSGKVENGTYKAKATDVSAFTSKGGTDFVKVTAEILEGPSEGMDHDWLYNLTGYPSKKGGTNYPGLSNLKRDLTNIGLLAKMPKQWPTDPKAMSTLLGKALQGARFQVIIKDGKENAQGKSYSETMLAPLPVREVEEDNDD